MAISKPAAPSFAVSGGWECVPANQGNHANALSNLRSRPVRFWNTDLIRQGMQYLALSATGDQLTSYHLEARIASWHCIKEDTPEKWEEILQLYNQLLLINYSPGVALNRTFALYKANGREQAMIELEKLKLEGNHFYMVLRDFLKKLPPH